MNSEDLKKWLKDRDYESLQFQPGQHFLIYKFNGNCIDCDSDRAGFDFVITRHPHYNPATPLALLQVTNDPHNPVRLKEPKDCQPKQEELSTSSQKFAELFERMILMERAQVRVAWDLGKIQAKIDSSDFGFQTFEDVRARHDIYTTGQRCNELQRRVEELELSVKGMSRHIEYLDDGLDKLEAWRKAE